ncbi:MAG TPA: hypothetical protein VH062_02775 [Polyangiaceae bacterium]|jgi:hypothetical protein|nr:hypothetical protein [Polyangiaceae bacterium]
MAEINGERIVGLLSGAESPFREELVAMAVEHALSRPLADFVDFEAGRDIVVRALTRDNLGRIFARHVKPGFDRYTAQVAGSSDSLGSLVPDEARARIRKLLAEGPVPRAVWARKIVDPALLRKLFAPVWANLFTSFAKRLPIPGLSAVTGAGSGSGGAGSGIAGRLSRSVQERAEKLVDRGLSAMGSLGAEVEKRVQAAAREFSDGAAEIWREALQARLKSREGREILAQITEQAFEHVMSAKLVELHEDAKHAKVEDILAASAAIVGHSVTTSFVGKTIEDEVAAFVASEGQRSLREVLDELGVLDDVQKVAVAQLSGVARGVFGGPAFADWVTRLLEA